MALFFGTILPWLLIAGLGWLFFQLVRQNGRILLRVEALEASLRELSAAPRATAGLPAGSPAPDFELADAAGIRHTLAGYRGKPVLLVFFDPKCGFCLEMVPRLAALPADGAGGRPIPVVVTAGGPAANADWVRRAGVRCPVLFDDHDRVAGHYRIDGTPTGYLIGPDGMIASGLAVGADALLALAGPAAPAPRGKANKGLEHSKINRNGLPAGTPAPDFSLPKLGGGEVSLAGYRGRRVLLVFSDPDCAPCTMLAPHLEEVHRSRPDVQVLAVSRGSPAANRQKADDLGLTFPVGLQKGWEVCKAYGTFNLPSGYLIDESGVLLTPVAVGVDAVKALADQMEPALAAR